MNILFVCKYNRFRSKVAEAYFKKINKNKNLKAESAGLIYDRPTDQKQKNFAKKYGIALKGKSRLLNLNLLKNQDLIVITADDVPKMLFNKKKVLIWKIPDSVYSIKLIMKKTKQLVKKLEKKWK